MTRKCPQCNKEIIYTNLCWFNRANKCNRKCQSCAQLGRRKSVETLYQSAIKRLFDRVDKNGPIPLHVSYLGQCWIWTSRKDTGGYGWLWYNNANEKAHRVSYILHNGPIPDRMCVCHHCDNPSCVRPDHLFLGTSKDNTQDMIKKVRDKMIGERNQFSKLTNSQALFIKQYPKHRGYVAHLCKMFNVGRYTIFNIRAGKSWTHIQGGDDPEGIASTR